MEREIALVQAKILQTEVTAAQVQKLTITKEETEGDAQFEQRLGRLKVEQKNHPMQLAAHKELLEGLCIQYLEHLEGKSFIGQKSGKLEEVDALLGRNK